MTGGSRKDAALHRVLTHAKIGELDKFHKLGLSYAQRRADFEKEE